MIKKKLVKAPTLTYYNPNKETVLQTDANIKGLGTCLLQNGKPVYFASKALTETQKGIHSNQTRILGSGVGHGKIPPFHIWHPLHPRDRSKTARGNTFKDFELGNTMIAENPHLNIPISFYSVPYSRTK